MFNGWSTEVQTLVRCFDVHVADIELCLASSVGIDSAMVPVLAISLVIRGLRPLKAYRQVMHLLRIKHHREPSALERLLKDPQQLTTFVRTVLSDMDKEYQMAKILLQLWNYGYERSAGSKPQPMVSSVHCLR